MQEVWLAGIKPFVANRAREIHRSSNPQQWRHIPGEMNPADLPTRGLSATELANSKVWAEGPSIIQCEESTWPSQLPNERDDESISNDERRKVTHATIETPGNNSIDPKHFSNFRNLVRTFGWVRRFLNNCKLLNEDREKRHTLSVRELKDSETWWIKKAQTEGFPEEKTDSCLTRFNPKEDDDGLLRADGRLRSSSDLPYDVKHPIILPKDHTVTHLIATSTHEQLAHGSGTEHLLSELRTRFWIVKGRRTVRNLVEKCTGCRIRFNRKPATQMMAPLPKSRLQQTMRAFGRVGVDYGGPYLMKRGRGKTRAKRYLRLFSMSRYTGRTFRNGLRPRYGFLYKCV